MLTVQYEDVLVRFVAAGIIYQDHLICFPKGKIQSRALPYELRLRVEDEPLFLLFLKRGLQAAKQFRHLNSTWHIDRFDLNDLREKPLALILEGRIERIHDRRVGW